jgi:hypothetical protein
LTIHGSVALTKYPDYFPNPDALPARVQAEEAKQARGMLRIQGFLRGGARSGKNLLHAGRPA